jgi:hypothetical protein
LSAHGRTQNRGAGSHLYIQMGVLVFMLIADRGDGWGAWDVRLLAAAVSMGQVGTNNMQGTFGSETRR